MPTMNPMIEPLATTIERTLLDLAADPKMPNTSGWKERHAAALAHPHGFETSILLACVALASYAAHTRRRYGSAIGEDGVLGGDGWTPMIRGTRALLNGESGRLDCGTIDAFLCKLAADNGVEL